MRFYSDGKIRVASWSRSGAELVDKDTGAKSRPEKTISVEYRLENGDEWAVPSFLESKPLRRLANKFGPPHSSIDFVETVVVRIIDPHGREKQIATREFYVASLEERTRYPSALIVLMDKIDEIEKAAYSNGKPAEAPSDCKLGPP
jgi:hypothetical protein